jgi:thiamine biosynthesis lipoprotein
MSDVFVHSSALMGTVVTIQVVGHGATPEEDRARRQAVTRALAWFHDVSERCSRFDPSSELRQMATHVDAPVRVSETLFEAVRFALAVAHATDGAFDPTVGARMERLGFNEEFRTGVMVETRTTRAVTFRDVILDDTHRTVTLTAPMMLDLGAVAKGLAIDLAARELASFGNFAVDAGGDMYLGGHNGAGAPWSVGIRHPRRDGEMLGTLRVSDAAVCTSGDYERTTATGDHHIVDARTGASVTALASVTVKAASAMVADALATAAFTLGPSAGLALLESQGVDGLIVSPSLERFATAGMHVE